MSDNGNNAEGINLAILTDAELASVMRTLVSQLNNCSAHALKRELVVLYQIKPANAPQGISAKLGVSVMTEVA